VVGPGEAPGALGSAVVGGPVLPVTCRRAASITSRARASPSPMAVPPLAFSVPRAARTASRSVVGGTRVSASLEKMTSPTWKRAGRRSRKRLAARWAASIRVGSTSSAFIDPDTSMTSMTVASSRGTGTRAIGLAAPSSSAMRASTSRAAGIQRPRRSRSTTPASTSRAG
jgi:hypothetical protein